MDPPQKIRVRVAGRKGAHWRDDDSSETAVQLMATELRNSDDFKRRVFREIYDEGDYRKVKTITLTREDILLSHEDRPEGIHREVSYCVLVDWEPIRVFHGTYTLCHQLMKVWYTIRLELPFYPVNTSMIPQPYTLTERDGGSLLRLELGDRYTLPYSNIKFSPQPCIVKWGAKRYPHGSKWAAKQARALIDLILKHNKKPL